MTREEAVVTRKGETTIPIELRKKYRIVEDSRLKAIDTGEGVLFKPILSFFDLADSDSRSNDGGSISQTGHFELFSQ